MRTSIARIGNSKGVIIPARLLRQCGFEDEVSLKVRQNTLIISRAHRSRAGWAEAIRKACVDDPLPADFANDFDDSEWQW